MNDTLKLTFATNSNLLCFYANKQTDEASRKIAENGIKDWIHGITGFKQEKFSPAQEFIKEHARIYKPEFHQEFYDELYRVTGCIRPKKVEVATPTLLCSFMSTSTKCLVKRF
jgi:hypothetical protein